MAAEATTRTLTLTVNGITEEDHSPSGAGYYAYAQAHARTPRLSFSDVFGDCPVEGLSHVRKSGGSKTPSGPDVEVARIARQLHALIYGDAREEAAQLACDVDAGLASDATRRDDVVELAVYLMQVGGYAHVVANVQDVRKCVMESPFSRPHSFVRVVIPAPPGQRANRTVEEFVIDPKFKAVFDYPAATPRYARVLDAVPDVLVCSRARLVQIVKFLHKELVYACHERAAAADDEFSLPPWRRLEAMLHKWSN